ncbi:cohesin domain-containing protein [Haloterrigena salinisoli]|uniref:cohesin domain-containing protein n=1 Tax=Haloterrigena salinisoli TaxID=3132747 RepID=UPI0030D34D6D
MPSERFATGLSAALAAVVACGLLLVPLAVAPAPAGAIDSATLLYFDSEGFNDDTTEIDAAAGETVTLDLVASTHGNPAGNGISELSYAIEYDPGVFTVTDVEQGSMLAGGGEDGNGTENGSATVDGTVEIDDENGVITVDQERIPPGNGTMGTGTTATLTLAISEDAPTTNETLEITDGSATFPSDYSVDPIQRDATVLVDGTAADDGGSSLEDPVPGPTPLSGLAAIGAALWLRARRAR